jgi:hypothetical protein
MIKTSYLKLSWKLSSIFSLALLLGIAMSSSILANEDEFAPGDKPGIISVNLVDNSNSDVLKINSLYHWYLVQACSRDRYS